MLLFDPSMSALPIIVKQNSASVGLFTHQQGTWAGFRPSWDRLVLYYCWRVVATVILLNTRGTAGSGIWFMCLADRPVARRYHLRAYDWTPLKSESLPDVQRRVRRPSASFPGYAAPSSGGGLTSHRTRPSHLGGLCPARADAAAFQFGVRAPDHSQTTQVWAGVS